VSPADRPPEDDPAKTPFLPILGYVLGFMGLLALLALAVALLFRAS
jgi:hypothetical protein